MVVLLPGTVNDSDCLGAIKSGGDPLPTKRNRLLSTPPLKDFFTKHNWRDHEQI
jgi:hypothetical protein